MRVAALVLALSAPLASVGHATPVYVAMGSSYAAGPGVTHPADTPPNRCARSEDNYAHQAARRLGLDLVDVSCSGATTANVLSSWGELPAQVAAVTSATKLVTLTIGGNDLNFVGNLDAASCQAAKETNCPAVKTPTEADYASVENAMHAIVVEIRRRAPKARIVFVEYPVVLPAQGTCVQAPMTPAQADMLRATAMRLVQITDEVAEKDLTDVIHFATHSTERDACGVDPWIFGYLDASGQKARVPYHPNLEGMTAVADDLVALLGKY